MPVKVAKQYTAVRKSITPEERVAITFRFLVTGDSYSSLQYFFKISKQVISRIIPEVCETISKNLLNSLCKGKAFINHGIVRTRLYIVSTRVMPRANRAFAELLEPIRPLSVHQSEYAFGQYQGVDQINFAETYWNIPEE